MAALPQLIEEDIQQLEDVLRELLAQTDATTALVADQGGFLIAQQGETRRFDLTTIAALAAGAYMASQTIAGLVLETNFNSIYQQGQRFSLFVMRVDDHCLLLVIFKASHSVGAVKYYAASAGPRIARQMKKARARNPGAGLDLAALNLADVSDVFKKR